MIPESQNITIERGSINREAFFKLNSNSAHLMKILRKGIYSNPILACVREYSVNALEAHILNNNQNKPIEVTLPNYIEPMFKIRDFGPGLTFKQICTLICEYGSTTKDESNEFVGCFGIGSKAAFSYSNTFQITSFHGGKKSIYNAYIDETEIGKISELLTEKSDEPSGIEIGIPVQLNDISSFERECKNLFRFWKVQPIIKGCSHYKPIVNEYYLINKNETWAFLKSEGYYSNSFLVMGGVPYKIDSSNITGLDNIHSKILSESVVLFASIGDVTIAANREEVSYTPKTIQYIKSVLRAIEEEAKGQIDEKFQNCKTEYEVRELYFQCFGGGTLSNVIHTSLFNGYELTFNNKKINSYLFGFDKDKMNTIHGFYRHISRRGNYTFKAYLNDNELDFYKEIKWQKIPPEGIMFYYVGAREDYLVKKLMKYYFTQQYAVGYPDLITSIINFKTDQDRIDWFAATGVPESQFKELISTIVIPKKPKKPRAPRQSNPKTNSVVYDNNDLLPNKGNYFYKSREWKSLDVDTKTEGGLYVIKNYSKMYLNLGDLERDTWNDALRVDLCINMLEQICPAFTNYPVVYAFNQSEIKKLGSKWVPLYDFAKEQLQLQHNRFDTEKIPFKISSMYSSEKIICELITNKKLELEDEHPLKDMLPNFEFDEEVIPIERYEDLCLYFNIDTKCYDNKKLTKFNKLIQKEMERYPLLSNLNQYNLDTKELLIYIRAKNQELSEKKLEKKLDLTLAEF